MRQTVTIAFAMLVFLGATPINAQDKSKEPMTMRRVLLVGWNDIGEKVVQLAENFPEDKYQFKPADQVRTFAQTMRHIAFWNDYVTRTARGEKVDGKPNELPEAQYKTKAQIVAAIKKSVAAGMAQLKSGPDPTPEAMAQWSGFIAHSSEHYGQLVVYYRLNGLVPPASRP